MPNYHPKEINSLDKLTTEQKDIIWASGHYLTEHFPDEYINWEQSQIEEWIEENKWEPFEYYPVSDIWNLIDSLAYSLRRYVKPTEEY